MSFVRHIIASVIAVLLTAVSAAAMPMMPTASDHAEFFPLQQTVTAEHTDVHFAARGPPPAAANVAITGAVVAEYGNGIIMHGHEIHVVSLGFGADFDAPNKGLDDLVSGGTRRTADDVNATFPDGYSPPYTPGTQVTEFVSDGNQTFVRITYKVFRTLTETTAPFKLSERSRECKTMRSPKRWGK